MRLSIIVPTLNEVAGIRRCLESLQPLRSSGHEIIIVDGGSSDDTVTMARTGADQVVDSVPGRAVQMNRGAQVARAEVLLFLHADCILPGSAAGAIAAALQGSPGWGRFDVRLTGAAASFRVVEFCMNLRSRLTGIATGDQAMFVSARLFREVGGFAAIPLMEDIDLSLRLKRLHPPHCLHDRVIASSRRWEHNGTVRTVVQMWVLRLCYALGADPATLARYYE